MKIISVLLVIIGLILGGCCDENFMNPDYDFRAFAIDVTLRKFDGCPNIPEFTTENATPDGEAPYCSSNPVNNRWFKFLQSTDTYVAVEVKSVSIGGTQQATIVTFWDTDGKTPLACMQGYGLDDDVYVSPGNLIEGEWYYISVDVAEPQYAGTFDICVFTD